MKAPKRTLIIIAVLFVSLFLGSSVSAHSKSSGSSQTKYYYWGAYAYLTHNETHKLINALEAGAVGSESIGTVGGIWIPGIPGKVIGTYGWLQGVSMSGTAKYIERKDHGKGIIIRAIRPNIKGWSPYKKYFITGIYSQ